MKLATLFGLFLCFSLGACSEAGVEEATPALLTIGNVQYSEGNAENELVFTVTLVGDNPGDISVDYRTEDGTARAGEDYEGVSSGQVTFGPTDTRQRISITLLDDFAFEPDESFSIILFNPVNAELLKDQALGTILNDDTQIDFQIPSTGYRTPTSYPNMTQVWADEFQAPSLNLDDWTHQLGNGCPNLCGWGNNELQYYQPENTIIAKNEYLVIEARKERVDGFSYTSSRIITQGKQSLKFGRVDIRAVLPIGQGLWPALWMLGDNIDQVSWPRCGEIDIMEIRGDQP
ncbi:MAG: Calx-beta domain-containing protein, partial [Bacteroidota bacterium]